MSYRTKTVEVDIELDDFDDDELIDELEDRGFSVFKDSLDISPDKFADEAHKLYVSYLSDSKENFNKTLREFFWEVLNKRV